MAGLLLMAGWQVAAKRSILAATITTIVALAVSAGIYLTNFSYWGSDLSQSLMVEYPGGALGGPQQNETARPREGMHRAAPERWVLIDIGPRFCASEDTHASTACGPGRTDPRRLASLIQWAAKKRPRVVVVDIAVIQSAAELNMFQTVLSDSSSMATPVLIAMPQDEARSSGSPNDPLIGVSREVGELLLPARAANVRVLPSLIQAPNPVSRLMVPEVRVIGGGPRTRLPTLAYAAALVARSPADDPFGALDSFGDAQSGTGSGKTCERLADVACRRAFAGSERVFSFPPAVAGYEQGADAEAERRSGSGFLYLYLPAPRTGQEDPAPPDLYDAVVVIGDMRRASESHHFTAIGEVSGAEILLNDVRQYATAVPGKQRTFLGYLGGEFPYLALGFLAAALVEWVMNRSRRKVRSLWRRLVVGLGTVVAVGLLTFLFFGTYLYFTPPQGARDFLTPFAALLFGSAIESVYRFSSTLETLFGVEDGVG